MPKGVYERKPQSSESVAKRAAANRGKKRSAEHCHRQSERQMGWKPDRGRAEGSYVTKQGYRSLTGQHGHPLAGTGDLLEHRKVLYDKIGPGSHLCHWGCGRILQWNIDLHVDHLDEDKLNNDPANVVASCCPCNSRRAAVRRWMRRVV